jgi:phosphopantetheine adenylyltransferase
MMPAETYTYVSSRLVKEVVALGGSVTNLVPSLVESGCARSATRGKH